MSFDLKNLEDAVLLFYQSDAKKKESTHDFLMQMQESPMAWQFAWDLMLPQKVCIVSKIQIPILIPPSLRSPVKCSSSAPVRCTKSY